MKAQVKGKDIYVDGNVVGSIIGSRDKSGKGYHEGYWISLKTGRSIGKFPQTGSHWKRGAFCYFADAREYAIANPHELTA